MTSVEEWRLVARAMAAHDVVIQVDAEVSEYWADHMFGARARQFIAAFDAMIEFRWPQRYVMGAEQPSEPADDDIERVARRMARSAARDNLGAPLQSIDGVVDRQWPNYRDAAVEHLNQLRSGNA